MTSVDVSARPTAATGLASAPAWAPVIGRRLDRTHLLLALADAVVLIAAAALAAGVLQTVDPVRADNLRIIRATPGAMLGRRGAYY